MRLMKPTSGGEPAVMRVFAEPRNEWYIKVLQPMRSAAGMGAAAGRNMLAGAALGAGLMYMLDPARGKRRRSLARDKMVHLGHVISEGLRKTGRDVAHRAQGRLAEARAGLRPDNADDYKLEQRVRSALGRATSHPSAIFVEAQDGRIVLSGAVLRHEADRLLAAVGGVRGVRGVEDRLEVHDSADVPQLQGAGRADRGGTPETWSPTTRTLTGAAGLAMLLGGWSRGGVTGAIVGGVGTALALRSMTNMSARRLTGIGAGPHAVQVQKTINIHRPLPEVFQRFSAYDNFPLLMSCVREVQDLGQGRSHWVVAGPMGMNVEWDAQVTGFEPNRLLAWTTVPGAAVENSGTVRFLDNGDGSTRVDIRLSYNPPMGALGHAAAMLFGADPKSEMDADLMRLKSVMETGKRPHDAAQNPPARRG